MTQEQLNERLPSNEIHYRSIFENSPVSFWEEDFSELKKHFDGLREKGILDIRAYFEEKPEAVVACYSLIRIIDVSQTTLTWYEAESKAELQSNLATIFTEESNMVLKEEMIALFEGKTIFRSEMYGITLKGNDLHTEVFLTIVPGYEETWEKILICDVDITEQKRLEKELRVRSERQTVLRSLGQNFFKEIELQQFLEKAVRVTAQELDLEYSMILEKAENAEGLSFRVGTDPASSLADVLEPVEDKGSLFEYCLSSRDSIIVDNARPDKRFSVPTIFADKELSNGLCVIIGDQDEPWGVLAGFTAKQRTISENEVNFMEAVARLLSMAMDRSKVEEQQTRLVAAIDQTAEIVVITNSHGIVQYVNPAYERITGYPVEHIVGMNVVSLNNGQEEDSVTNDVQQSMRSNQVWKGKFIHQKKDDSLLTLEATISPVRDRYHRTTNHVVVMRDITQYLELENRLRHSQKVQAIGTLAGGIAHDFNNILAGIIGFTELAQDSVPKEGQLYDMLFEIKLGAIRATELVEQILTFSRKGEHAWKPMKIQPLVREAIKLLRNAFPATITINSTISEDCGIMQGNESQIHQVILNLCSNGYHAMIKEGGTLDVQVDEIQLEAKEAKIKELKEGSYIRIQVKDTGHGMSEATMARIFEPYFTTKEAGLGTGLGLSTVLGIVETHGGEVSVESNLGKGSKFEVLLPVYIPKENEVLDEVKVEGTVERPPMGHGEHILFVDDEEPIVRSSQAALAKYGYRVTAMGNSEEALDAFRRAPGNFDLVITDQIMPKLTGFEMAKQILEIRPGIPIMLATGFSESVNREEVQAAGLADFYMKPISSSKLAQRIHQVLAATQDDEASGQF
jgi:PAS domain S-box-containing protein